MSMLIYRCFPLMLYVQSNLPLPSNLFAVSEVNIYKASISTSISTSVQDLPIPNHPQLPFIQLRSPISWPVMQNPPPSPFPSRTNPRHIYNPPVSTTTSLQPRLIPLIAQNALHELSASCGQDRKQRIAQPMRILITALQPYTGALADFGQVKGNAVVSPNLERVGVVVLVCARVICVGQ